MPPRRKVLLEKSVVATIGQFGLDRQVTVALLNELHTVLAQLPRTNRVPGDDRYFSCRLVVHGTFHEHYFPMLVDDTTSPDHLIVGSIGHATRDRDT